MADRADWDAATRRQRHLAVAADTELRRRHPGIDLPPLQLDEEQAPGIAARAAWPVDDAGPFTSRRDQARLDIEAATSAARYAGHIIAARQGQGRRNVGKETDDLMRAREAEALREARARRTAAPQERLGGRHAARQARPDLEPEAGG
jgi:hypothetical protein